MTFGAVAAWQAVLLIAAAGALAAWLFRLKVRPPRLILPSLLLWRRVLDESRELTFWERVRRAVSLALTVAVALVLALAVTRPSRSGRGAGAPRGRTLILLDASPSMLARTKSGDTRWTLAIAEAQRIAEGSADAVSLATTADGLVEGPTTDAGPIESALDRLAPSGDAGWWPGNSVADSVHFITDGAIARPTAAALSRQASTVARRTSDLPPFPPTGFHLRASRYGGQDGGQADLGPRELVVHSVFEPASNVAITAFDVRPSLAGDHAAEAYLEVANYATSAQAVHLTIARGRTPVLDRRLEMRAGEALRQVLPIPRGGDATLRARIDAPADALASDNQAVAWIPRARPLLVTVVGQHTSWLASLLARDPDVRPTFVDPSSEAHPSGEDLVIFDRWTPKNPPHRPSLSFAPPLPTTAEELRPAWNVVGSHPVLSGVDPFTLSIEKARAFKLPQLSVVAESARGTPLIYAGESDDQRAVVVTFGPADSNLPSAPAFPVLVGNALDWLARVSSGGSRRPGPMAFDEAIVSVTDPEGEAVSLTHFNHSAVALLRSPGMYFADGSAARTAIAVNSGDPQISNLLQTRLTSEERSHPVAGGLSQRPWWVYLVALAFAIALAEWWTWQRRITV
jgi:hypothetical protein